MSGRIRMLALDELAPEVHAMVSKWAAEGGDPNFSRTFGRLPALLRDFITFYSRLMRKGLLPVRLKELVRLRLAQLNTCHY
jgi:Carboxymuconolactone decarboxylase family